MAAAAAVQWQKQVAYVTTVFTPMTMSSILFVLVLSFLDSRVLLKESRIKGRLNRVATFPTGIDPERFIHALELPQVQENVKNIKGTFAGRKVRVGVDLLDMIKGILQKILAFEKFVKETLLGTNICPGIISLYLKILFQVLLVLLVINAVGHSNASICRMSVYHASSRFILLAYLNC